MPPAFDLLASTAGGHVVLRIDSVGGFLRGAIGVRHGRDPLGTGGGQPENRPDGTPCMDRPHEAGNCSRATRFAAVAAGRCQRVRLVVRVTENRPASAVLSRLFLDALACDLAGKPPGVSQSDQTAFELLFGVVATRFTARQSGEFDGQREQVKKLPVAPLLFIRVSHGRCP